MQSAHALPDPFLAAHAAILYMRPVRVQYPECTCAGRIRHAHRRRPDRDTFSDKRVGGVSRCHALRATESGSEPRKAEIRKLMISHILRNPTFSEVTLFAKRNAFCAHSNDEQTQRACVRTRIQQ